MSEISVRIYVDVDLRDEAGRSVVPDLFRPGVPGQPVDDEMIGTYDGAYALASLTEGQAKGLRGWPRESAQIRAGLAAVLDALAAAGRLIPAGSEVVEEWGARISHVDHPDEPQDSWRGRRGAESVVAVQAQRRATNPAWQGRAELIRRLVITTPAEVVADQTVPMEDQ
jgi:hypothetical protein